jgi:ribosomal protein L40E
MCEETEEPRENDFEVVVCLDCNVVQEIVFVKCKACGGTDLVVCDFSDDDIEDES